MEPNNSKPSNGRYTVYKCIFPYGENQTQSVLYRPWTLLITCQPSTILLKLVSFILLNPQLLILFLVFVLSPTFSSCSVWIQLIMHTKLDKFSLVNQPCHIYTFFMSLLPTESLTTVTECFQPFPGVLVS